MVRHGEHHVSPARSKTLSHAWTPLAWEPGDILEGRCSVRSSGPHREGRTRNPMMNVQGKSDLPIVPMKLSNNAGLAAAETGEGRGRAKGNAIQGGTGQTQGWESVSLALDRIRDAARRDIVNAWDQGGMRRVGRITATS